MVLNELQRQIIQRYGRHPIEEQNQDVLRILLTLGVNETDYRMVESEILHNDMNEWKRGLRELTPKEQRMVDTRMELAAVKLVDLERSTGTQQTVETVKDEMLMALAVLSKRVTKGSRGGQHGIQ